MKIFGIVLFIVALVYLARLWWRSGDIPLPPAGTASQNGDPTPPRDGTRGPPAGR